MAGWEVEGEGGCRGQLTGVLSPSGHADEWQMCHCWTQESCTGSQILFATGLGSYSKLVLLVVHAAVDGVAGRQHTVISLEELGLVPFVFASS